MRDRPGHGVTLSYYDFGQTPFFALQADQRISYCLYVPKDYEEDGDKTYSLAVLMHGTGRTAPPIATASWTSPTPMTASCWRRCSRPGSSPPGELSNYKRLAFHDMRFGACCCWPWSTR